MSIIDIIEKRYRPTRVLEQDLDGKRVPAQCTSGHSERGTTRTGTRARPPPHIQAAFSNRTTFHSPPIAWASLAHRRRAHSSLMSTNLAEPAQGQLRAPAPTPSAAVAPPQWPESLPLAPRTRRSTRIRARARLIERVGLAAAGLGLGVSLALTLNALLPLTWDAASVLGAIQSLAAVAGTYLALVLLALAARIPILESTIGHARLIAVHRTLGPWTVWLILIHVALVVPYQALTLGTNWINQAWSMLTTQAWIVAALAGLALFVAVGLSSWRRIRGRLPRDLWWTIHLYAYLGIALAFAHQITAGGPFMSGWERVWWIGLYVAVASSLVIWRVAVPTIRSWRADTRVAAVIDEAPGISSVWITGKGLGTWGAKPGQFVTVHFWERGLFFEGHPYSLSAPIVNDSMRITVKAVGAASSTTQHLQPGTRVWIEGPYGVMTPERALTKRAVLVGGGIGIAPMIALAYDLAQRSDVDVIIRVHFREELALRDDLERLYRTPRVNIHLLVGSRAQHPLDAQHLHALVPHVGASDLYVCGPQSFMDSIAASATHLGVSADRIHRESFCD